MKPTLEKIINNLVSSFTGADRDFYEREFKFFGDVTAISGYLKEYIKYGQTEKKPMQKVSMLKGGRYYLKLVYSPQTPYHDRNAWMKSWLKSRWM